METLYLLAIFFEMVIVNFYTLNYCSTAKIRQGILWLYFFLFTFALLSVMALLLPRFSGLGMGNGAFMPLGFIYIVPAYLIYRQSFKHLLIVMCTSWTYTMLIFSMSMRIMMFFPSDTSNLVPLLIQTLLYACTLKSFLCFIKQQFINILRNVDSKTLNGLLFLSFFWFISCVLLNYVLVVHTSSWLEFVLMVMLGTIIFRSYHLFNDLVHARQNAEQLRRQNRTDPLTGLKNRISFYEDAQALIDQGRPFSLIFIDLDRFKTINDRYGHSAGDRYLAGFARAARRVSAGMGEAYRISGDEFILLCSLEQTERLRGRLERSPISLGKGEPEFLGFSFGIASYPENGQQLDELIVLADHSMYTHKSRLSQIKGR